MPIESWSAAASTACELTSLLPMLLPASDVRGGTIVDELVE